MTKILEHANPVAASEGATGFVMAFDEADGIRITLRQHGGGPAGETFVLPRDKARALADAILQRTEESA